MIRDSFVNGLGSNYIRQRLFELKDLNLKTAFETARSLEMAHKHADSYLESTNVVAHVTPKIEPKENTNFQEVREEEISVSAATKVKCYFYGFDKHPRNKCPAKNAACNSCSKIGHWPKCC